MENDRSSFVAQWRDLADHICPWRPKFTVSEKNRGERKNKKIIDSTATLAVRTLRSGMMSGISSPSRPWFRLTIPDPDLAQYNPVKEWLYTTTQRMQTVFLRSNMYNILPIVYGDTGVFGTGGMLIEEDFHKVIHCFSVPIGSYMIATDRKGKVNTFFREFRMTVRQVVEKFGRTHGSDIDWSNLSNHVKVMWERGEYQSSIDVCHIIMPNEEYSPDSFLSKNKEYISVYYEKGSPSGSRSSYSQGDTQNKLLREMGYDYFPFLCPRWEVSGEDDYGTECPGMSALGDIRQLQAGEKRSAQAYELSIHPSLQGPPELRNQRISALPGDITFVNTQGVNKGISPIYEVNPRLNEFEIKQEQIRQRIKKAFYEDLFLMLASTDRRDITAREIDERHEEKLLALGPVLEQMGQDLHDPAIDITFNLMNRQGWIPTPPDELQDMELKVEYISIMAQAQKLIGLAGVERFMGFAGQIMALNPEVADKIDFDQSVDEYAEITSLPPTIIRSDEDVEIIRQQRGQIQAAQASMEMMQQGANTAKELSQANFSGDNALSKIAESQDGDEAA